MTVKQRFIIVKVLLGGFNNQKAMFGASSGHSACMFKGLFSIMSKYIFNVIELVGIVNQEKAIRDFETSNSAKVCFQL